MKMTNLKQLILCAVLFFISAISAIASNDEEITGIISGKVTTVDGNPAPEVTVSIKGTNKITLTDENGNFVFKHIANGSYEIEVSLVGYETIHQTVVIDNNKSTLLSFKLKLSSKQLQEVIVTSTKNKFTRTISDDVAKVSLKNLENSQVYTTLTKELLADQMVFTADDAIKNSPGLQKMWEATNRSGDGGSYYNSRGFILQSTLRNGVAGNVANTIDAANIESIEVIKGPSATLFGSSLTSYGGLINRITKKPFESFGGEVSYASGSYGYNRISADVNAPLTKEKDILFRANAAYTTQGSFQDNGFERGCIFAPSITYKASDRLTFNFDAELFGGANSSKQIIFFYYPVSQLNATNPSQLGIDYKRSYSDPSIYQTYRTANFFAQAKYKISDKWTSQTNVTNTNSFSDGPYAYFYVVPNSVVSGNPAATGADYLQRSDQSTSNNTVNTTEIQQNFTGDFTIGIIRNRFVGGLDYYTDNSNQLFYGADFDIVQKNGNIPNYNRFNRDNLNAVLQDTNKVWTYPYYYKNSTYSAYVSDVINITNRLILNAGVRLDYFDNKGNLDKTSDTYTGGYTQTSISPKFGLVYQLIENKISLFGNYQNGFTNETGSDVNGKVFKPEQANQIEGGIKLNLLQGKLVSTINYYSINVKDIIRADQTHPNFSVQDGTQVSKGIEAEVTANPVTGLNVMAGFSYNDSKLEKADPDVEGRRPATAMSPTTANLWASYKIPTGKVKGLGFGFGGNYASANKILNTSYYGVFTLPAYTILNASVFYDQPKFKLSLKADNLTNKEYWIGYSSMNPQKLRSITASISFKF